MTDQMYTGGYVVFLEGKNKLDIENATRWSGVEENARKNTMGLMIRNSERVFLMGSE